MALGAFYLILWHTQWDHSKWSLAEIKSFPIRYDLSGYASRPSFIFLKIEIDCLKMNGFHPFSLLI